MTNRVGECVVGRARSAVFLLVLALSLLVPATAFAGSIPVIGGTPDLTSEATFTAGAGAGKWSAEVFSYAFIGTAGVDDLPPAVPALPEPDAGQTLFIYVIKMSNDPGADPASVNQFDVANPIPVPVQTVGFDESIIPTGGDPDPYDPLFRQTPSSFQSSLPAGSVSYFFDQLGTLDPGGPSPAHGEFSLVFFLADGLPALVPGTVTGGAATFDEHEVLGPVPEPATLGLLVFGMALGLARGRRSS